MKGIMSDVNMEGQSRIIIENLRRGTFSEVWEELGFQLSFFADHCLQPNLPDRDVWRFCQANGWVLLTDNRNADDKDSLQQTIAEEGTLTSLPIITVSNATRLVKDLNYRQDVAISLLEYLLDIDLYRGSGHLYLPRRNL